MALNITLADRYYGNALQRNAARRLLGGGGVHVTVTLRWGQTVAGTLTALRNDENVGYPTITLYGYSHADMPESRDYPLNAVRSIRDTPSDECLQCDAGLSSPNRVDIAY